jgi:hypothetical protein
VAPFELEKLSRIITMIINTVVSEKIGPQKISQWGAKLKVLRNPTGEGKITSPWGGPKVKWANLFRHYGSWRWITMSHIMRLCDRKLSHSINTIINNN